MTKLRPPLSFENALTKVAGHIGWERTAAIVGQAPRTVRNWSEPDTTAKITLDAALQLDVEYHKAGGEGTPFLLCYATRVEADRIAASPELQALIDCAASAAKEGGEAVSATLHAAKPRASIADLVIAEREHEDAISAHTKSLAALRARREALTTEQGTGRRTAAVRGREVPQPAPA
jgi:hypothetical protein